MKVGGCLCFPYWSFLPSLGGIFHGVLLLITFLGIAFSTAKPPSVPRIDPCVCCAVESQCVKTEFDRGPRIWAILA